MSQSPSRFDVSFWCCRRWDSGVRREMETLRENKRGRGGRRREQGTMLLYLFSLPVITTRSNRMKFRLPTPPLRCFFYSLLFALSPRFNTWTRLIEFVIEFVVSFTYNMTNLQRHDRHVIWFVCQYFLRKNSGILHDIFFCSTRG